MNQDVSVIHNVTKWLPITNTWIYNQLKHLPTNIHNQVVSETVLNLDQFPFPNLNTYAREDGPWKNVPKALRKLGLINTFGPLDATIRRVRPQVLHSHFGNIGWFNTVHAKKHALKHVTTFYGFDVNKLPQSAIWRERYKDLFENVSLILCEGPHMAKCIQSLGCPAEKIRVQHLGIDLRNLPYVERTWDGNEPFRFLIAGSFREKKGIPYALEALGRLKRHTENFSVTIIGDASADPDSQEEKSKILETIKRCDLTHNVNLLGYQPYKVLLAEAYQHHCFVSPSVTSTSGDTEGGAPVTIIEMIATGIPIASTTHCDIPNLFPDEQRALLVQERNTDQLSDRLLKIVSNYPQFKNQTETRKYIETHFDADIQGRKLAQHYLDLVK